MCGSHEHLADDQPPAGLQHARDLAQRRVLVRDLAQHGDEHGRVEAVVGVRQRLRVAERRAARS